MKLYHRNITADGEPSAIFAIAEDVDSLPHTLEYQDHGEADEESLLPYFDGEKKPQVVRSLEEAPEDYLDFVCPGDNPGDTPWLSSLIRMKSRRLLRDAWRGRR